MAASRSSVLADHVPEDAKRRLDMGAALVKIYTGLIYAGQAGTKNHPGSLTPGGCLEPEFLT